MPETPVHQRHKRHQAVTTAMRGEQQRDAPAFSSKYLGLEKEVDSRAKSSIEEQKNEYRAEVHEGKVRTSNFMFWSCFTMNILMLTYILHGR
jgi:hypothetical protein